MKVRLLENCQARNPAFRPPDPREGMDAYRRYRRLVPADITLPAGTIIDDPEAFRLCESGFSNGRPLAEPVDDEARAEHAAYLAARENRVDLLRALAAAAEPDDPHGAHVIALAKAYRCYDGPCSADEDPDA